MKMFVTIKGHVFFLDGANTCWVILNGTTKWLNGGDGTWYNMYRNYSLFKLTEMEIK